MSAIESCGSVYGSPHSSHQDELDEPAPAVNHGPHLTVVSGRGEAGIGHDINVSESVMIGRTPLSTPRRSR
jgi:hypothetical protein